MLMFLQILPDVCGMRNDFPRNDYFRDAYLVEHWRSQVISRGEERT